MSEWPPNRRQQVSAEDLLEVREHTQPELDQEELELHARMLDEAELRSTGIQEASVGDNHIEEDETPAPEEETAEGHGHENAAHGHDDAAPHEGEAHDAIHSMEAGALHKAHDDHGGGGHKEHGGGGHGGGHGSGHGHAGGGHGHGGGHGSKGFLSSIGGFFSSLFKLPFENIAGLASMFNAKGGGGGGSHSSGGHGGGH